MKDENLNKEKTANSDLGAVSGMYVDEYGFLMCGPVGMSTSMVEGLRCTWHNEDDLSLRIEPINDLGEICGEYYR